MIARQKEHEMTHLVRLALEDCGHPQLRGVHVRARQGHVTLEGCVPSYYGKQLAQAISLNVDGVTTLENRIAVEPRIGNQWSGRAR